MLHVELPRIGPYMPVRSLGEGSTAHTHLYRNEQRKKYTVIKFTRAPLVTLEEKEAFLNRAKLLKKLKHRYITEVLECALHSMGEPLEDYGYIVMQYIEGSTIAERFVAGQSYAPDEVRRVLLSLADTLQYAHKMFATHGNLHPGNVLQTEKDFFLTDFSLTTLDSDAPARAVLYRAPEQLRDARKGTTPSSDQYALAIMVYEWLCGHRPYAATTAQELLYQQEHEPLPAPSSLNPQINPLAEKVLLQALALDPHERFPQPLAFSDTYLHALMGRPPAVPLRSLPELTLNPPAKIETSNPAQPASSAPAAQEAYPLPASSRKSRKGAASQPGARTAAGAESVAQMHPAYALQSPPAEPTLTVVRRYVEQTSQEIAVESASERSGQSPLSLVRERQAATIGKVIPAPLESAERAVLSAASSDLQHRVEADLRQGGVLSVALSGYEERPAQIEMAALVAHSIAENVPAIIEASTGTGKALDVDTPMPTPDGWKRMGDLRIGDLVFDERGEPTAVTAAFSVMHNRPCYEVAFSDGSTLIADAEHEWASFTLSERKQAKQPLPSTLYQTRQTAILERPQPFAQTYTLVTTEQMAATLTADASKQANHAIALAGALTLPAVELSIAPYALGASLGSSAEPASSIPPRYLRASEQQRRALLAGLLDTGGCVNSCGALEFTTTHPQLAHDIYELLCSLALQPVLRPGKASACATDCGSQWRLTFTTEQEVFRLAQKALAHKADLRDSDLADQCFRYVKSVRPVESRPVRCIQVEAASHLYLAGRSMIPTHNSLAYLTSVVRSGKIAIISTANKALQEQLYFKDIPFIQKYIRRIDAALVKGMGNYICLDRVEQERVGFQHYTKNRDFTRLLERIEESDENFSGDFEMLGFTLAADVRAKVNADRDQCTWSKCSYFTDCYVHKMKTRASQASIIVVNHTLLLLDALMEGKLLPERDVIIVDEAHHLEEEATRAFTTTISPGQIATLLSQSMLKNHTPLSLQDEARATMNLAWERLAAVSDPGAKGRANLREPFQEGLGLASMVDKLADALRTGRPKDLDEKDEQLYDKLITRAQNLAADIRIVFSVDQSEKYVYYVESVKTGRRGIDNRQLEVSAAPLEVTSWLREQLFDKSNVICTSATLATIGPDPARPEVKGPNFAYFRRRVGLEHTSYPNMQERILPLTFDYEGRALLYLPRHIPEPAYGDGLAEQEYTRAIGHEMMKLVEASRGRAFLLFSSKRMLDKVFDIFMSELPSHLKFPLLRQGDMTRLELVRSFREREGAVLFGLKSFWEGVDIAGEALSLVVIDKLPFDPPDDPVHEARVAQMKAAGENWFGIYVLPQTVLRLKQGLGRLLRTHNDRGVMAILDTRLYTKSYGKQIVQALPPARRAFNMETVTRFFQAPDDEDEEEAPF
ncbi:MAG TPA: helicase C-terminal domain-containing protein [Ktedonobacteraceae bacterium]